uniref:Uncharacterized protein n=1 Tax=Meloidogyne enterolobii TaxID=390850 RepID=A0A6V7V1Y8_MELEN|nr:unnamed protein product [Meloidogyne enterolobii]
MNGLLYYNVNFKDPTVFYVGRIPKLKMFILERNICLNETKNE